MINDLLPRYYEIFGDNPTYTIIRSIVIDGHEVAWTRHNGMVMLNLANGWREEQPYVAFMLHCECDFTRDVGWGIVENEPYHAGNSQNECLYRRAGVFLRQLELRREYESDILDNIFSAASDDITEKIIFDLVKKVKAGEFIGEDSNRANFLGGYFHLQTLAAIMDLPMETIWREANRLIVNKKISLNGAVFQDYKPSPS